MPFSRVQSRTELQTSTRNKHQATNSRQCPTVRRILTLVHHVYRIVTAAILELICASSLLPSKTLSFANRRISCEARDDDPQRQASWALVLPATSQILDASANEHTHTHTEDNAQHKEFGNWGFASRASLSVSTTLGRSQSQLRKRFGYNAVIQAPLPDT
jgi:hypothetical protein